ncbi:hypothetical protein [Sulfitobacter sp. SH22]|uniref:hypothetical protein n=1 Tax=Sulfitobacter sp. SH22 TaxID=3421172 RepID=UPI003F4FF962
MAKKILITSSKIKRRRNSIEDALKCIALELTDKQCLLDSYARKLSELEDDPSEDLRGLPIQLCKYESELADVLVRKECLESEKLGVDAEIHIALRDHLAVVNGKAHTYVLTASDVILLAEEAEQTLIRKGVTIKNRVGSELEFRPAGKDANASYARKAGPQITTFVKMIRVTDGWRLVEAHRDNSWCNQKEHWKMGVSNAARDEIVLNAMRSIFVHPKGAA